MIKLVLKKELILVDIRNPWGVISNRWRRLKPGTYNLFLIKNPFGSGSFYRVEGETLGGGVEFFKSPVRQKDDGFNLIIDNNDLVDTGEEE